MDITEDIVLGKLLNILSNHIAGDYEIDFVKLGKILGERLPQIDNVQSNSELIDKLNALGYTSVPKLPDELF